MMERSALSTAQALAVQAQRLVDHARRISPQVEPVGRVTIADGSVTVFIIKIPSLNAENPALSSQTSFLTTIGPMRLSTVRT